jgi:nucleotidyltransferase substrate binding protein (TIGR01987 family)
MINDVRWKQRFQNFSKAFARLEEAVININNPSDLEKEGIIQRFEFTHELAWKVMKDFLTDQGITGIIGSKDACRYAFQNELIEKDEIWMKMIESRNITIHSYDEGILDREFQLITKEYYPLLNNFYKKMCSF